MKKHLALLVFVMFIANAVKSQHILPVSLLSKPDSLDVAIFGEFTFDGSTVSERTWSTTGQSGFVVHSKPRKFAQDLKFTQIIVDFNPIIIGWDPFNWNTLIKHSVDSFYVQKMPFAGDCFLHIGLKRNFLKGQYMTGGKQKYLHSYFADFYWRPYNIEKNNENYRFQTVNLSTGYQFGYLQKEIPVIGVLLISTSLQLNYMYINESDNYLNSYKEITEQYYNGNNYAGCGFKMLAQTKTLNMYAEMRQYWAIDNNYSGNTFTKNPTLIVGAFYNMNFYTRKSEKTQEIKYQ